MTSKEALFSHANPLIAELLQLSGVLCDLRAVSELLSWDLEVFMPKGSASARSFHTSTLEVICHEKQTSPRIGYLLSKLEDVNQDSLTLHGKALIRETRRAYDRAKKLPKKLVGDIAQATATGFANWERAKKESDFSLFRDSLQHIFELKKETAHCIGFAQSPYDALLDEYEPGTTVSQIESLFISLRQSLIPLVERYSMVAIDDSFLSQDVEDWIQEDLCREILSAMGFNFTTGRLDKSSHPFTTSFDSTDVRLTTRYEEESCLSSLFSSIHEGGHGLYEQGVDARLSRTALAGGVSLGVHESQSRFWENIIGRSSAFWESWYPYLCDALIRHEYTVPEFSQFMQCINKVRPSLIRVNADEVTYNLHIILRFEIEKALIEGTMLVDEIPDAWNEKMEKYLGVVPGTIADGCLQDVHWSCGLVGYFPTYTIGNLLSAQLLKTLRTDHPDMDECIEKGELSFMREWLRERVHCHGLTYPPEELIRKVTGEDLNPSYFVEYLTAKMATLFG